MFYKPYNVDKGYNFLRATAQALKFEQTLDALDFAMNMHDGQFRKDGQPAIAHPLWMTNFLIGLEMHEDRLLAVTLLHDVCEDTGVAVGTLPVDDDVKRSVSLLTLPTVQEEEKHTMKKLYFARLLESRKSTIVKAVDRLHNLRSMAGVLDPEAIRHNVEETHDMLLPLLDVAGHRWSRYSNLLNTLSEMISALNDTLATVYNVPLYDNRDQERDDMENLLAQSTW